MHCPNRDCIDFQETGQPGEYRDDVEVCPKCGSRLIHERPDLRPDAEGDLEEGVEAETPVGPLVAVAAFDYRQEADLAASMLQANGVPAIVFAGPFGNDPRTEFAQHARVMVSERDPQLARTLLEQEVREPEGQA
ncbi:MAG: hypothetical protein LAO05_03545 [Acidobacteriia bacterium]|nr:hypothetical protein [Terriglobia bacterium]